MSEELDRSQLSPWNFSIPPEPCKDCDKWKSLSEDLLKAAEKALETLKHFPMVEGEVDALEKAIAKAREMGL